MIRVADFLEREAPDVRMLLQVHDELLFEGPEDELAADRDRAVRHHGRRLRAEGARCTST